jgi:hypothetical protein
MEWYMLYVVTPMHVIFVPARRLVLCASAVTPGVLLTEIWMIKVLRSVLRGKDTLREWMGDEVGVCLRILILDEWQVVALRLGGDLRRLPLW